MSIINRIVNNWYNLNIVSQVNEDGIVKPMQEYSQEVKKVIDDIYNEHATLLKDAQDGYEVILLVNLTVPYYTLNVLDVGKVKNV